MSYDLVVFDAVIAPMQREEFIAWYDKQCEWAEPHSYDNPRLTSPWLAAWFMDMIKSFPPMNGPFRTEDINDPKATDYSIGSAMIYAAFAGSEGAAAYQEVCRLAAVHGVGFFDASGDGDIVFPF